MKNRKKPATFRKFRGVSDTQLVGAIRELHERLSRLESNMTVVGMKLGLVQPRPTAAEDIEAAREQAKVETMAADVCPSCHGTGGFEYRRADGEVFSEVCPDCNDQDDPASNAYIEAVRAGEVPQEG